MIIERLNFSEVSNSTNQELPEEKYPQESISHDNLCDYFDSVKSRIPDELITRHDWEERIYGADNITAPAVYKELTQFISEREKSIDGPNPLGELWSEDIDVLTKEKIRKNVDHLVDENKGRELLGAGGYAHVHIDSFDDGFCMKIAHEGTELQTVSEFLREVTIQDLVANKIKHSTVFTPKPIYCKTTKPHAILMERVHGCNLEEIGLHHEKASRFINILSTDHHVHIQVITDFILEMHKLGVLHGDLHPRNIMLTDDFRWAIIDFGKSHFEYSLEEDPLEDTQGNNEVNRFQLKQDKEISRISGIVNSVYEAIRIANINQS